MSSCRFALVIFGTPLVYSVFKQYSIFSGSEPYRLPLGPPVRVHDANPLATRETSPKNARNIPNTSIKKPKTANDAPKRRQDAHRTPNKASWRTLDALEMSKDVARRVQTGSRAICYRFLVGTWCLVGTSFAPKSMSTSKAHLLKRILALQRKTES